MTLTEISPNVLYNAKEAAAFFRCGLTNIYDLWESGELAVINIGKGRKGKRVKGSDLLAFIESRREGGPQPKIRFKHLQGMN